MDADEKRTTTPCKKLYELPPVATDWQQTTWCPDCDYYDRGTCGNPMRTEGNAACPFDDKALPLREAAEETNDDLPQKPLEAALRKGPEGLPRSQALEQAIKHGIMTRTGGRIQSLEVDILGRKVTIRGNVPCYHVKQLALQGILDVMGAAPATRIELDLQVAGRTAMSGANS
jgi:hypothetical protein